MEHRSLFSHTGQSLCIFCQVGCAGALWHFPCDGCAAQLHAWRGDTSKATISFLRTQLSFVVMNKRSPSLVYLGVLCAETWVVTGNLEAVLQNKDRIYLCGCQIFGVHTGLKWSTPCSRKSLLHTGLCQLWDEILLPRKSQASEVSNLTGVEFSAVYCLFCPFLPLGFPGKHRNPWDFISRQGWGGFCMDGDIATPHKGKHLHWRGSGLGST